MSTSTPLKCPSGGTPSHFTIYSSYKYCNCHGPNSGYGTTVSCGGTKETSYCLLGCSTCYTFLKTKKENDERDKKELENLKKREAEWKKREAEWKKREAELERDNQDLKIKLEKSQKSLERERKTWEYLNESSQYSEIFLSPTITIKLTHPKAGPFGIAYNLHLNRLAAVSSFFRELSESLTTNPYYTSKEHHPIAFTYFVEFLYSGNYVLPESLLQVACYIHTLVYFLAQKLGAPDLKELAKRKLEESLHSNDGEEPGDQVVVKMVDATYAGTAVELENKGGELVTRVMVTPCSSRAEDEDDDDDDATASQVSVGESTTAMPASDRVLHRTLAFLDLDENTEFTSTNDVASDPHPMRLLVSTYAASRLESLNKRSDFRALLRRFPEFTVDMMIAKDAIAKEKK